MVKKASYFDKLLWYPSTDTFEGQTRFSIPDIDGEQVEAEWKIFPHIMFTSYNNCSNSTVLANLLTNSTLKESWFFYLEYLAAIALVLQGLSKEVFVTRN